MGVDFYLRWTEQTSDEQDAQITGFATVGERGYIRESYGGDALATEVFCPESFASDPCYVVRDPESFVIPDANGQEVGIVAIDVLRSRMPATREAAARRYGGDPTFAAQHAQAFEDFLGLAESRLDAGRTVWIHNSY